MTTDMLHVDDFIDDPTSDPYAARWFGLFRRPAFDKFLAPNPNKLFATYDGKRWRVIGCSRLGDVWLSSDFSRENGYERRVDVARCSDWAATPAECLCNDIDPSDRPCLVCEARAVLSSGEIGKGGTK